MACSQIVSHHLLLLTTILCFAAKRRSYHVAAGYYIADNQECRWRNDSLLGKCFGLECGSGPQKNATNPRACAELCCAMGDDCITWQFREDIGTVYLLVCKLNASSLVGCCVGAIVRLGDEQAGCSRKKIY
jgi:hypothetical protein